MSSEKCQFCGKRANCLGGGATHCGDDECVNKGWKIRADKHNQERQTLKQAGKCTFDECWAGFCKKPGSPYCDRHSKYKCHCGKQATYNCPTASSMVCGANLCDNCKCRSYGCR